MGISDYEQLARYAFGGDPRSAEQLLEFVRKYERGELTPAFIFRHESAGMAAAMLLTLLAGLVAERALRYRWCVPVAAAGAYALAIAVPDLLPPVHLVLPIAAVVVLHRLHT